MNFAIIFIWFPSARPFSSINLESSFFHMSFPPFFIRWCNQLNQPSIRFLLQVVPSIFEHMVQSSWSTFNPGSFTNCFLYFRVDAIKLIDLESSFFHKSFPPFLCRGSNQVDWRSSLLRAITTIHGFWSSRARLLLATQVRSGCPPAPSFLFLFLSLSL